MPHPAHGAAASRDSMLSRVRKLSLWITGGAAAASLGLGASFAHALPGHTRVTGAASSQAGTGVRATTAHVPAHVPAHAIATPRHAAAPHQLIPAHRATPAHHQAPAAAHPQHRLAPPKQRPAAAPAQPARAQAAPPAQVSSGGS
jgi:hypothetical protein